MVGGADWWRSKWWVGLTGGDLSGGWGWVIEIVGGAG